MAKININFLLMIIIITCFLLKITKCEIIIKQMVEGSSYNKILEIKNTEDKALNLSDYTLQIAHNGGDWKNVANPISTSISLTEEQTYVMCHSNVEDYVKNYCDDYQGDLDFNGNDAIRIIHVFFIFYF